MRDRVIIDPMEDITGRFLSREESQPNEDEIIAAIDRKYKVIHLNVLYLKRQGYSPEEIRRILGIGEMAYIKAVNKLKNNAAKWKLYIAKPRRRKYVQRGEQEDIKAGSNMEPTKENNVSRGGTVQRVVLRKQDRKNVQANNTIPKEKPTIK